jgi:nickel transport protein
MMKRSIMFAPALALFPCMLFAHGVEVSIATNTGAARSEIVRFIYSTGEPMAFAIIRVFAPSKPAIETVQSITDRNGYFSFVPDEAGEWRVTAEDGMGHKGSITVPVIGASDDADADAAMTAASKSNTPLRIMLPFRILLGLSLIANVFAVYQFVLKKRELKKENV